jgi:glycine betaine catabolism B
MIFALSEDFVNAADTKDIQPSQMKEVEVNSEKVCLANVEGKYYAIGNVCTHLGGPLAQGKLEGYEVQCPWHGSRFDITTGKVVRPPAMRLEPTYEIKIENDNILLKKRTNEDQS